MKESVFETHVTCLLCVRLHTVRTKEKRFCAILYACTVSVLLSYKKMERNNVNLLQEHIMSGLFLVNLPGIYLLTARVALGTRLHIIGRRPTVN